MCYVSSAIASYSDEDWLYIARQDLLEEASTQFISDNEREPDLDNHADYKEMRNRYNEIINDTLDYMWE